MKQEKIAEMERAIAADYANIAGMVVLKNGERVYENYFGNCTEDSRIHVFSVTKSVVFVLIGMALDRDISAGSTKECWTSTRNTRPSAARRRSRILRSGTCSP